MYWEYWGFTIPGTIFVLFFIFGLIASYFENDSTPIKGALIIGWFAAFIVFIVIFFSKASWEQDKATIQIIQQAVGNKPILCASFFIEHYIENYKIEGDRVIWIDQNRIFEIGYCKPLE